MPWVESPASAGVPIGEGVFRAVAHHEPCLDRNDEPAFRMRLVTEDGQPFYYFTSQRFGVGSTLRAITEAAAGQRLPRRVNTDAYTGKPFRGELIAHPEHPNLRRFAWVSAMDGSLRSLIRANGGKTWIELAEASQETRS